MSDSEQPNDKRPRSSWVGTTYHFVAKGDTTIRPRRASLPYTPPRDQAAKPAQDPPPVTDADGEPAAGS